MLSKEQQAMAQYHLYSLPVKETIGETKLEPLIALNNALIDAVSYFGVSEIYARQGERAQFVKDTETTKSSMGRTKRYNETGLKILSHAHKHLDDLAAQLGKGRPLDRDKEVRKTVSLSLDELRSFIADSDIKPNDIKKLCKAVDEIEKISIKDGHKGVLNLLKKQLSELQKLRSRPDRGAIENIAWWKIAAIIAAFGIFVIAVFHCGWFGCSVDWAKAYTIGFNVALAIALYC